MYQFCVTYRTADGRTGTDGITVPARSATAAWPHATTLARQLLPDGATLVAVEPA